MAFPIPASPHFGDLWEAGLKSVKHHLKRQESDADASRILQNRFLNILPASNVGIRKYIMFIIIYQEFIDKTNNCVFIFASKLELSVVKCRCSSGSGKDMFICV